jgi:hypothetical protein
VDLPAVYERSNENSDEGNRNAAHEALELSDNASRSKMP